MQELSYDEVKEKLSQGELEPHQFYNTDLESSQRFGIDHYLENEQDNIDVDQTLNIVFSDIEVFTNSTGKFKVEQGAVSNVCADTVYSTFEKIYHVFFLVLPQITTLISQNNIQNYEKRMTEYLLEKGYIEKDEQIKIYLYYNELQMLKDIWALKRRIDPAVLSGFNSDAYDYPYLHQRTLNLLNGNEKETNKLISRFGSVKVKRFKTMTLIEIPEFALMDLRRLYMPRDEGGLNYGKKQSSYSLDWISQMELKLQKLDYNKDGKNLDQLYLTDPYTLILYNIVDVVLCVKLNNKLKHIDLHNLLRRDMKTPMSISLRGSSALFDTYFSYSLEKFHNLKVKHGIAQERKNSISSAEIKKIPKPKDNKIKWKVKTVDMRSYSKIVNRFPGAYVKEGYGKIVTETMGLLADMDKKCPLA